jgi:hypothetical protein
VWFAGSRDDNIAYGGEPEQSWDLEAETQKTGFQQEMNNLQVMAVDTDRIVVVLMDGRGCCCRSWK